jgi:RNA polymerase sigma-70 factor (ECF subfamily)
VTGSTGTNAIEARIGQIVRASHGRLVALIASRTGDIAGAEDALADAYRAAIEKWPVAGLPENPSAWLLAVARNRLKDQHKSAYHRTSTSLFDENGEAMEIAMPATALVQDELPDERLKLMFAAAHPAIDEAIRAPLILQTVLGLEAADIAKLFLVPVATMAQRLVRAKTKIRDARIPFVIPGREHWPERLEAVLEAIYGAYSAGLDDVADITQDRGVEALHLADLLAVLLPGDAESLGLAALLCFSASRAEARFTDTGDFVPLDEQDPADWDPALIAQGAALLARAATLKRLGRFQLEAAVHAVHADRRRTGATNWRAVAQLYAGLAALAPTHGVLVAQAWAAGQADGVDAGFAALSRLEPDIASAWPPALICAALLHERAGRMTEARTALRSALGQTLHTPYRVWLERKAEAWAAKPA